MSSILDHPLISARYFFPRREPLPEPFFVESDDCRLACYHHTPHRRARTLVYFHGNGEVVAECVELLAEEFSRLGWNAFFAEYRGYGMSSGTPALAAMLDDVPRMVAAAGAAETDLIFFGRSVGSIYAIAATRHFPRAAGLVIESGIADPLERILLRVRPEELGVTKRRFEAEVHERLPHRELLEAFRRPALILHTRHDGLIDVSHAERLYAWAGGPKKLTVFERGDHNTVFTANAEAYMAELGALAARLDRERS